MRRPRILLAIPVFNEERYVDRVLAEVDRYRDLCIDSVLVIDDGSRDSTPARLAAHRVEVIRHAENRGYGRSMMDAMRWACVDGFDWLLTMDCDEQHEPAAIPDFVAAIVADDADVISGSRYLLARPDDDLPPEDRRSINRTITAELNARLDLRLTDSFCGFKAYRTASLERLELDVDGYDFPMQFWPEAVAKGLVIREIPVRLIYNDPNRSFGGPLDDAANRLRVYRRTLHRQLRLRDDVLPASAVAGLDAIDAASDWADCG